MAPFRWLDFGVICACLLGLSAEELTAHITKGDQVFPHFLSTQLPPGLAGLVMAALIGTAMCALSSDLSAFASMGVQDIYRPWRPNSTEPQRLFVGKAITLVCGLAAIGVALVLSHTQSGALSLWFSASAVSDGLAGLFLLAFTSRRATGADAGIAACVLFTAWVTLTLGEKRVLDLGRFNFHGTIT